MIISKVEEGSKIEVFNNNKILIVETLNIHGPWIILKNVLI